MYESTAGPISLGKKRRTTPAAAHTTRLTTTRSPIRRIAGAGMPRMEGGRVNLGKRQEKRAIAPVDGRPPEPKMQSGTWVGGCVRGQKGGARLSL